MNQFLPQLTLLLLISGCSSPAEQKFQGTWEGPILVQDYRIEHLTNDKADKLVPNKPGEKLDWPEAVKLRLEFLPQNQLKLTAIKAAGEESQQVSYQIADVFQDEYTLQLDIPNTNPESSSEPIVVILRFESDKSLIFKQVDGDTRVLPIEMKKI